MAKKNQADLGKKDEPGKSKRGPYKQKECPYCRNHFGNVRNHIKTVHPTESAAEATPAPAISKEELLSGNKPPTPPKPEDQVYYCQNCRAELRKGENPCWNCGEAMAWEKVSEQ